MRTTGLVGMLTDRDITVRSVSAGHDPCADTVRDAMTREAIFCFDDQDVAEAAQLMKRRRVRRLVVLTQGMKLAGIVSLGDLAMHNCNNQLAAGVLQAVSEPATPVR
jgi:CBS domain-containing protein